MGGSQMRSSRMGATQAGIGGNDHRVRLPAVVEVLLKQHRLPVCYKTFTLLSVHSLAPDSYIRHVSQLHPVSTRHLAGGNLLQQVFDEEGRERTPKPMLSLRPNNIRPLPSLIGESQASVTSDTDRGSMMSEMGHLERLSSAAFSTGSSRMSAGYGSNTLTPELSIGSQMGISVSAMATGIESKVDNALISLSHFIILPNLVVPQDLSCVLVIA